MTEPIPLTPRQIYMRAWKAANRERENTAGREYYEANKDKIAQKAHIRHEANKEAAKEKSRIYYEANKEAVKGRHRAWVVANKVKVAETRSAWRGANKEYINEKSREWCKANPEYKRNASAKRLAVPGVITPGWIPKLLELQRWTCIVCNKDLRFGYHIDHIEPIARGGENTDYNLQALCPRCNLEKSDKDPIEFMQSRGFLL